MFHFPGCPPVRLLIHLTVTAHYHSRVPPFGHPGIKAYLQLPQAFRSLSRPSSAISALASTLRSYSLDLPRKLLSFRPSFPISFNPAFARSCRSFASSRSYRVPKTVETRYKRSLICSFLSCAVFKVRSVFTHAIQLSKRAGGLKWTRTTDLSLIRRVL